MADNTNIYVNDIHMSFPLTRAVELLDCPHEAGYNTTKDFAFIVDCFADVQITGLTLDDRTAPFQVTFNEASSNETVEWIDESEIIDLLTTLAPIIPDGSYLSCENKFHDIDSRLYRLVIAGGRVVEDFPNLTWDDPVEIAATDITRVTGRSVARNETPADGTDTTSGTESGTASFPVIERRKTVTHNNRSYTADLAVVDSVDYNIPRDVFAVNLSIVDSVTYTTEGLVTTAVPHGGSVRTAMMLTGDQLKTLAKNPGQEWANGFTGTPLYVLSPGGTSTGTRTEGVMLLNGTIVTH